MSFCSSWATLSKTRHLWFIHIHLFQSLHFFLSFLLSFLSPCDHQSLFVLSLKWCPGWTVLRPASRLSSGKFLTTFRHSFLLQSVRRQMSSYCSTLKSQVLKNTVSSLEGHSLLAAEKVQESSTHPMGAVSTLFLWSEEKKKKTKQWQQYSCLNMTRVCSEHYLQKSCDRYLNTIIICSEQDLR